MSILYIFSFYTLSFCVYNSVLLIRLISFCLKGGGGATINLNFYLNSWYCHKGPAYQCLDLILTIFMFNLDRGLKGTNIEKCVVTLLNLLHIFIIILFLLLSYFYPFHFNLDRWLKGTNIKKCLESILLGHLFEMH